jgi:hypothetical protein
MNDSEGVGINSWFAIAIIHHSKITPKNPAHANGKRSRKNIGLAYRQITLLATAATDAKFN